MCKQSDTYEVLLEDFKIRIEELEISNDTSQYNLGVIKEIVAIISEFPAGKTIINRATNRYKLKYLDQVVLPRRQKALNDLEKDIVLPLPIRQTFIKTENTLIDKALRAKERREMFEHKAAVIVGNFLQKLLR